MTIRLCLVLILALPFGCQAAAHTTVLRGKAARPLFHQCSRPSPAQVGGDWTPTARDLKALEQDLTGFFKSRKSAMRRDNRQYAGFLRHGRRMIYINGIPPIGDVRWKTTAMVACDGGSAFYGVEYDTQTRRFQNLEFNGPPEGKGAKR